MVDKKYHPLTIWDVDVQEELSSPPPTANSAESNPLPNASSSLDRPEASRPSANHTKERTASESSSNSEHHGLADLFVEPTSSSENGGEIRDRRGSGVYKRVSCLKELCCKGGEAGCCAGEEGK